MKLIDWLIKIIWVIIGVVLFEAVWIIILKNYLPEFLIYPPSDLGRGLATFFWGSIIFMPLGAALGLILPKYFFSKETNQSQTLESFKGNVLIFVSVILIIAVDAGIIGLMDNFEAFAPGRRWFPDELDPYLWTLMVAINLIALYFLHKKIVKYLRP